MKSIGMLESSWVLRGGYLGGSLSEETNKIECGADGPYFCLRFQLKSKGGGQTAVSAEIGYKDFPKLLECMTEADRTESFNAMLSELKRSNKSFEEDTNDQIEILLKRLYPEYRKPVVRPRKKAPRKKAARKKR